VALDADDRVALVRQWRLPANAALVEIPAGGLDVHDGVKEDPEVAARRELEEETGMRAGTWQKLAEFYSAPGFTEELMHLYLASDLEPASADGRLGPDEDERLILEWRPWRDAVAAVVHGEIRDAKSVAGLLWLERIRRADDPTASGAAPVAAGAAPGATPVETAGAGDSVTVDYRLTIGEAVRATVGLARRSVLIRWLGIFMVVITAIAALGGDPFAIVGVVIGLGIVSGWALAPFAWWQFHNRPDLVGADIRMTADDDGLVFDGPFNKGRTTWSTFQKVHDVAGCLLFDNAAGVSIIVPKRAFSASQLGALYRLIERKELLPV
jgi:8-oxo-dGTP pyrophosphatase MutT (NUDIX family)